MGDVRTGYQGDRDSIGTFLDEYYVPNSEHEPMPPTHGFDFSDQDHGGSATGGPHINGRFIHETGQLENQMNNVSLTSSPQPIQAGGRPPYPDGPSGSNPEMRPRPGVRPGLPTGRPPLGSNPPSQSSRSQSRGDPGIATGPQPIPEPPASARPVLPVNKAHSATSTKSPPAKHYDEAGKILATLPIPPPPEKTSVGAKDGSGKSKPEKVTAEILSALRVKAQSAPSNMQLQIDLAKRIAEAAEGGVVGGATPKIVEANKKRYRDESLNIMKKAAIAGNPEAMFFIADNHSAGTCGLELSPEKAFPMYEKAAMKGHVPAMFRTAVSYEIGLEGGGGTQHSIPKAMEWYNRSAQGGDTASMYKLGVIQLKGLLGQPRSFRDATQWLNRAAEQADEDNPHALHELALLHMAPPPNTGFPRDYARSTDLLHRAAELGYKFSQFRLGQAYEHGQLGLPVDPQQSIKWYSAAAAQEEHQSELAISGWYLTGAPDGILDQNDTEAFLWAMKAAGGDLDVQQQNDAEGRRPLPKAEFAMGYFCEVGIGREKDVARAWEWYVRAARNGDPRARGRLDEMERANRGVYGPGGQGDVGQRKRSREGEWFQGSQ